MYKIVDESILFFSRFSLSKFSLEALYILWVRVFIVGYDMECEKSFFSKTGCIGESLAIEMSRKFQSPVTRLGQTILFFL